MSITVTGKLNKEATIFQAGESTGFGVRIGVKYYDRQTKQNEWTNYKAAIFVRNESQAQFYRQALVKDAIVELTGKQAKIESYESQNGTVLSIELIDASIGFIHSEQRNNNAPQNQQQAQYHQAQQSNLDDVQF